MHNGVGLLPSQIITTFWKWATAAEHQQYLKLFFEVHGLALQGPAQYGPYLEGAVASWVEMMASTLPDRLPQKKRHALATLAVGAVAGLLLDYLSSRNQPRTSEALAIFAKSFDPMVLSES